MKRLFAIAIVGTALLAPGAAGAGERVTDAALGAVSGALVAGPFGLVAGGVIGYAAGPDISRSMGINHHHRERNRSAVNRPSEKVGDAR
jgi:outer membrane lipoprotein SlyB